MCCENRKKIDDIMTVAVEEIASTNMQGRNDFIKKQNVRIRQLRAIEDRKNQGRHIHKGPIMKKLQRAGILDQNGEIAAPYRKEE